MDSDTESGEGDKKYNRIYSRHLTVDSKTLLQVNATAIVGILFFLSLTSYFPFESYAAVMTTFLLLPFVASAVIILDPFPSALAIWIGTRRNPLELDSQELRSTAMRYARQITMLGFMYLIFQVIYTISVTPPFARTITQECAVNPARFGVNETQPWKCSMFIEGSLAELCAKEPKVFNMSEKDCSGFIPPTDTGS
jgi:hypothetical protein